MSIVDEANRLADSGGAQAALDLLARAVGAGDPEAMVELAEWRLYGLHGPRDLAAAHALLKNAGERGHTGAIRLRATLIVNGTGCRSDVEHGIRLLKRIRNAEPSAAVQLALTEKMAPDWKAAKLAVETLSAAPLVFSVPGLFGHEECRYVMAAAAPRLEPSYVIDVASGRRIPHPVRTSHGTSFGPAEEDLVVHRLNRRIARITNTKVGWGEPLHILSYAPGQEYRPHVDALPGVANQRHWTVLVYLNEDYSGGETCFDRPGIVYKGRTGDALVFRNVDADGRSDPATRHAGRPVTSGGKWLATRWIRQAPYHPWAKAG